MLTLPMCSDVSAFSLKGLVVDGFVLDVYDGDSVTVVFAFKGEYYKWKCRLYGIDTPEIRTKDVNEKKKGFEAKEYLQQKILNKNVIVKCHDFDKYGRVLTDLYCAGDEHTDCVHINKDLLDNGYAQPYYC